MTITRRRALLLAGGAAAGALLPVASLAGSYPERPVRMILPVPAGGTADTCARIVCRSLSTRLGQPFVVENHPGAATNIGTEIATRAPHDGYTLLTITANNATNASVFEHLSFDFQRDIIPVARTIRVPLVLEVHPSVPAKTVSELIALAKAGPGKLNMASPGIGSPAHIAGELFAMMTGVKFTHVPYRGDAPAIADLIGGQVQLYFGFLPASLQHIKAGKLRALAVSTVTRLGTLPEIPAIGESVPGYEATSWNGVGAPTGTPASVIARLDRQINMTLADGDVKRRLTALGAIVDGCSAAEFKTFIAQEIKKWAKVVHFAGIKA